MDIIISSDYMVYIHTKSVVSDIGTCICWIVYAYIMFIENITETHFRYMLIQYLSLLSVNIVNGFPKRCLGYLHKTEFYFF